MKLEENIKQKKALIIILHDKIKEMIELREKELEVIPTYLKQISEVQVLFP